ncbi:MAG TPA: T9SS type A sorting domain-containing protein [Bacteroidia bacterium]|jgi:hypothetical protein|nr:T9SS type A sorting domain-containing protein [Bacteroidia bacterium]
MKKNYFAFLFLCACTYAYSQCTPRPLPFIESFPTSALSACQPTVGGWTGTSAPSQAGWWIPSPPTNYAGGSPPEVEAFGNQANGGISETISLTSPPINTVSVPTYTLQFKHNLFLTNSAASGSGVISILVETSGDKITWTQRHTATYNATSSLTSVLLETRTLVINGNTADTTYLRFSISGVLYKVWGWEIDALGVIAPTTTSVVDLYGNSAYFAPNPFNESIRVNCGTNESTHIIINDLLGNIVFETVTEKGELIIDTQKFAAGAYILKTQDKSGTTTSQKIIKN